MPLDLKLPYIKTKSVNLETCKWLNSPLSVFIFPSLNMNELKGNVKATNVF